MLTRRYTVKANHVADISTNVDAAKRLGLGDASEEMLHLLSTTVLAKVISPCEAAAIACGFPIVEQSDAVGVINTAPPEHRKRVRVGVSLNIPQVDVYCQRPAEFEAMTLTQYFKAFLVTKVS